MATFKVGQRARIIRARVNPQYVGCECTIIGPLQVITTETGGTKMRYPISIDGVGIRNPLTGGKWATSPDNLEPLQYDGSKTVEWSECLWQPEHLRVTV